MIPQIPDHRPDKVLIHAPFGRDADLLREVVEREGMGPKICPTIDGLCEDIRKGAAAILVGDEALDTWALQRLQRVIGEQPRWSDLPVFVMTGAMESNSRIKYLNKFQALGNVSLLNRPLRAETIVSAFRMALRARFRQYDVRDLLEADRRSAILLARTNAELLRANEDLNQFAYSVSHDLQEPLRMVAIYTQLLGREYRGQPGTKTSEYMAFVVNGANRLEKLLKDLLSYVQVVNSTDEEVVRSDANQVLQEALKNLRRPIEEAEVIVEASVLPIVWVKPVHLLQLFQNLIGNAIKYRGESRLSISISAIQRDEEWRFNVQDNGIGVEPQFAQHIFGVFKRLHGAEEKYSGTGIGLAICQKIVQRYGGRIWVESEGIGKGSLFSFTLPSAGSGGNIAAS